MTQQPFDYQVPAFAMRTLKKSKPIKAWRTETPGLIATEAVEGQNLFNVTHENSGFILLSLRRTLTDALCDAKGFKDIGVDWTVKTGAEIHAQVARLSDEGIKKLNAARGVKDKDIAGFRKHQAETAANFKEVVNQKRNKIR
jgi:hypothetical protein